MSGSKLRSWVMKRIGSATTTGLWDRFVAHAALQHEFASALARAHPVATREQLWDEVVASAGPDRPHVFLEFGVWQGYSMRHFARALAHPDSRFYGFDSFEGLPTDWGTMPKGTFTTGGAVPAIDDARVEFVAGWFQNTVDAALDRALAPAAPRSVIVHFDADLYSSTLFLLAKLHERLDCYRMVFDEFPGHECRALLNFQQAFGCKVEFDCYTLGPTRQFPMQVGGRMDNRRRNFILE